MRAGFPVDEIALIHGVPPWRIDPSRPVPNLWKRLFWRMRAGVYRIGLRRLAVLGIASD